MIPARMGSQRLKGKNLRPFNGTTLIEHAIIRCKHANCFDRIVLNTEAQELSEIAAKHDIEYFQRDPKFADNIATSEEFIADYFEKSECSDVFQVHSITPLLTPVEIANFVRFCSEGQHDTVLSCIEDQIEVAYQDLPVNFRYDSKTNSQDLKPVQRITWAITYWKKKTFMEARSKGNCGTYSGNIGFHKVSNFSGLAIKTIEDLEIATALHGARND